ncbi:thiamine phosphate synthase [Myxococcota bacterium]|nr:thiamine phosphate synthase [Myxococcota bacterium]
MSTPRLLAITDRRVMGAEPITLARRLIERGGPDVAVLVRERDLDAHTLLVWLRALAPVARAHGAGLFVSERVDVARAAGVDPWLPEEGIELDDARRLWPEARIGASVHDAAGLTRALARADLVTIAPVLPTPSKPQTVAGDAPVLGLEGLRGLVTSIAAHPRRASVRVLALGGLDARHVDDLLAMGVDGIAAIRAAWQSDALLDALRGVRR